MDCCRRHSDRVEKHEACSGLLDLLLGAARPASAVDEEDDVHDRARSQLRAMTSLPGARSFAVEVLA
jgi:hypothetical protein